MGLATALLMLSACTSPIGNVAQGKGSPAPSQTAGASGTNWPSFMPTLEPAYSESLVTAKLPANLALSKPPADRNVELARWHGRWRGWACRRWACDIKIVVDQLEAGGARVAYAAASKSLAPYYKRGKASFVNGELRLPLVQQSTLVMRLRADNDMEMLVERRDGRWVVAGVLTRRAMGYQRFVERVPTPYVANGQRQTLRVVRYAPEGDGPFPTILMNHGSTRPAQVADSAAEPPLGAYFARLGWQTVFAHRRGRGGSDGEYNEGYVKGTTRYSCEPAESLPGVDRALHDIDAVMGYLADSNSVKADSIVVGGISRGGILSVAYAGSHPRRVAGVINFVGGWLDERCANADTVNSQVFRRGGTYPSPMLWVYGEPDPFYSLVHSKENFAAFERAGGQGKFLSYRLPQGQDGHYVHSRPDLWHHAMAQYLSALRSR